jgi:hypothetical protein
VRRFAVRLPWRGADGACQTPKLGDIDGALRSFREFAAQASSAEVELLLFPECFLQGYLVTERHVRVPGPSMSPRRSSPWCWRRWRGSGKRWCSA